MNIISYLDEIEDIKSCMLTSKEVREEMFKTSKIMRRIKLQFLIKNDYQGGKLKFLIAKGEFIRNIKLIVIGKSENLTRFIIHQVSNLEKFCFINYYSSYEHFDELIFECGKFELFQEPAKLDKLKKFCFRSYYVGSLIENMAKVDTLEDLTFSLQEELAEHENDFFYNFLARQEQLKSWTAGRFPQRFFIIKDLGTKFKFQLKSITCSINDPNFDIFFQSQTEYLEELYGNSLYPKIFENIVKNCKKLRTLECNYFEHLSHNLPVDWRMETVHELDASYTRLKCSLMKVYKRFPYLESLKCYCLEDASGIFKNLLSLDIELFCLVRFQNITFPNLLNLKIGIIREPITENNWKIFLQNFPKIEILKIKLLRTKDKFVPNFIFECLKSCEKIEIFEIWNQQMIFNFKFKIGNPGKFHVEVINEIFNDFRIVENLKIKKGKKCNKHIDSYLPPHIDHCC